MYAHNVVSCHVSSGRGRFPTMIFRKPRLQTTTSRRSHEHTFLGALSLAGSCGGLGLGVSPKPLPACKTGRLRLLNGAALVSRLLTRNAGTGRTSVVNMIAVADADRLIRAMSSTSLLQHLEVCVCACACSPGSSALYAGVQGLAGVPHRGMSAGL